jgi:hypothetical protein
MDEFEPEELKLFPPFAESLKLLEENAQNSLVNTPEYGIMKHGDGGLGSGRYPEGSGEEVPEVNPSGDNDFKVKGFRNQQKLNNHLQKHQKDYPGWTKEQFVKRALELVQSPVGNGILGHADKNGKIIRYDTSTNDFVTGRPDKGVYTMYKPLTGQKYYDGQLEDDLKNG